MTAAAYDLTNFTLKDLAACAAEVKALGETAQSMEELCIKITRVLRERLSVGLTEEPKAEPALALVRLFKTQRLKDLPDELQAIANSGRELALGEDTLCLTLLGSSGVNPRWNQRKFSKGHQAIPLEDVASIQRIPMIASLLQGFGVNIEEMLHGDPLFLQDWGNNNFNVFFIKEAHRSEWIPAQEEFVVPMRIKSVLGCGGLLPDGEVFALVMFSRVAISEDTAAMFRSLSIALRSALAPFVYRVFA